MSQSGKILFFIIGALVAGVSLTMLAPLPSLEAIAEDDCTTAEWVPVEAVPVEKKEASLFWANGCIKAGNTSVRFVSVAIPLSETKLTLQGSAPDGNVPSEDDVDLYYTKKESGEETPNTYSLQQFVKARTDNPPRLAIPIGYPIDTEDFSPDGLMRMNGAVVAERDLVSSFKSALLCLNEVKRNTVGGSRVLVFNAFEKGSPIRLNKRVTDAENCPDVVQIGPRIVEYRGKQGIRKRELHNKAQRWLVFSQGEGKAQHGYVTLFIDPINLYTIQNAFVGAQPFSKFDKTMRVAVALTSGHHSGLYLRNRSQTTNESDTNDSATVTAKPHTEFWGKTDSPHPLFLVIQ